MQYTSRQRGREFSDAQDGSRERSLCACVYHLLLQGNKQAQISTLNQAAATAAAVNAGNGISINHAAHRPQQEMPAQLFGMQAVSLVPATQSKCPVLTNMMGGSAAPAAPFPGSVGVATPKAADRRRTDTTQHLVAASAPHTCL